MVFREQFWARLKTLDVELVNLLHLLHKWHHYEEKNAYIKIIPHLNSVNIIATIIPLTSSTSKTVTTFVPTPESQSWVPFQTLADFKYTETAVASQLSEKLINKQLNRFCNKWLIGGSHLTIHTYNNMQKSLEKAREYGIKVSCK